MRPAIRSLPVRRSATEGGGAAEVGRGTLGGLWQMSGCHRPQAGAKGQTRARVGMLRTAHACGVDERAPGAQQAHGTPQEGTLVRDNLFEGCASGRLQQPGAQAES